MYADQKWKQISSESGRCRSQPSDVNRTAEIPAWRLLPCYIYGTRSPLRRVKPSYLPSPAAGVDSTPLRDHGGGRRSAAARVLRRRRVLPGGVVRELGRVRAGADGDGAAAAGPGDGEVGRRRGAPRGARLERRQNEADADVVGPHLVRRRRRHLRAHG
uniref:Uncharacterized protein n=1 Tax=Oryza brachyantha TaxID=4533 RepID=J3NEY4_ORYBR